MKQYIGCDLHRDYSVFASVDESGRISGPWRVEHDREGLRAFLRKFPAGTEIAVEATGIWYWMVDELETAGLQPRLADSYEAKQRIRGPHKTDPLDARGLAILLRNGTLPCVWIPTAKLRDLRALMRTRLALVAQRTTIKNRIVAAVNRYGLRDDQVGDPFVGKGRLRLNVYIASMPKQTREAALEEWAVVDELREHIENLEERITQNIGRIGYVRLLKTMPGIGEILGATIWLEVGDVERFPSAGHLASYAGLVPTVHASGGKVHLGPTTRQSNHFLRWAFVEAACSIVALQATSTRFNSHRAALPPPEAQMPWQGGGGRGAASGGIDLVDFKKQTALPRAGTARGVFVHARASAALGVTLVRLWL